MAVSWLESIQWSRPHSISELTTGHGSRTVIPPDRGFYAFVEGCHPPSPDRCLYLGIAISARGLYGRLGSYLRAAVTPAEAAQIKHRGKRLITFARLNGVRDSDTGGMEMNDSFIHLCWAVSPVDFDDMKRADAREYGFMLERALVDYFRPLYNTADWERDLELELDEDYIP
jgi:hypothetical protein